MWHRTTKKLIGCSSKGPLEIMHRRCIFAAFSTSMGMGLVSGFHLLHPESFAKIERTRQFDDSIFNLFLILKKMR